MITGSDRTGAQVTWLLPLHRITLAGIAYLAPAAPFIASSGSPLGSVAGDITTYILGYGVLGVAAVLFTMRVIVPRSAVDEAKEQARVDLVAENVRLIAEKARAYEQRDEAIQIAQEKVVPLLVTFNATVSALLPILQDLVRVQEEMTRKPRGTTRGG